MDDSGVSSWSVGLFGDGADATRLALVRGLVEADQTTFESQQASRLPTRHPSGGNWTATYVRIVEYMRELPGAVVVHPPHFCIDLVAVNNKLFLPFLHSKVLNKPLAEARLTKPLPASVFDGFGRWLEGDPTLFDDSPTDELPSWLRALVPDPTNPPKVIPVPYVRNADGLLAAWWGEATRTEGGYLRWTYFEPLPLQGYPPPPAVDGDSSSPTRPGPVPTPRPIRPGNANKIPNFDEGEVPPLDFPRRVRPTDSPMSEALPAESAVENDE